MATQGPRQGGVRRDAALLPPPARRARRRRAPEHPRRRPTTCDGLRRGRPRHRRHPAHPRHPRRRPPQGRRLPRRPARRRARRRARRDHRRRRHRLRRRRVPHRRRRQGQRGPGGVLPPVGRRHGLHGAPAASPPPSAPPRRARSTCSSARPPRSAPDSARPPAGSTAPSSSTAASPWSRACSYDRIDDAGLHVTVGEASSQVLEVDTIVLCTGQEPRRDLYESCVAAGRVRAPHRRRRRGRRTGRQARHQAGHASWRRASSAAPRRFVEGCWAGQAGCRGRGRRRSRGSLRGCRRAGPVGRKLSW